MTTKLEAINTMLSCIGQSPLSSLEGTKSYYTVMALQILEKECKRVLLEGWQFNTEEDYELRPDINNQIAITDDMLLVYFPQYCGNRYVVRNNKLYDKDKHTFEIKQSLKCRVVWNFEFEAIPENFKHYVMISSAYKFCKRALGSQTESAYTKEDVIEAYKDLQGYELETGNYSIIPEMRNGQIRGEI